MIYHVFIRSNTTGKTLFEVTVDTVDDFVEVSGRGELPRVYDLEDAQKRADDCFVITDSEDDDEED